MTGGDRPVHGGLAQLARAFDLHSKGHRFDSDILQVTKVNSLPRSGDWKQQKCWLRD